MKRCIGAGGTRHLLAGERLASRDATPIQPRLRRRFGSMRAIGTKRRTLVIDGDDGALPSLYIEKHKIEICVHAG